MTSSVHADELRVSDASGDRVALFPLEIDYAAGRKTIEDRFLAAELELRREKERVALLLALNEAVASNAPVQEMVRGIVASVRDSIRCDAVAVFLFGDGSSHLRLCAEARCDGSALDGEQAVHSARGVLGAVLRSRVPWIGNLADAAEPAKRSSFFEGFRSGCVLPLAVQDRAIGILVLGRREEWTLSSDALEFLLNLGKQIAVAVEYSRAVAENADLKARRVAGELGCRDEDRRQPEFGGIVGKSPALCRALKQIETVSSADSTVLVHGETGTGKELLARAVHDLSGRRSGPFVKLNCAAISAGLLESELFGHEKGAFTGAFAQRVGRFEAAHGGTIFLDEVGEIPLDLQPKLLRVLQEREFERVGGSRTLRTDTRVVAATNRDLKDMVARGGFRSDLFYRLNVFPIRVPALRDRPEDIPLLVRHVVEDVCRRMGRSILRIPSSTMRVLCRYAWPGNVRELQNVVERAVILSAGPVLEIDAEELEATDRPSRTEDGEADGTPLSMVRTALRQAQRDEILRALKEAGGRVGGPEGAAAKLGLKRTTFIARMRKLGIEARPAAA